jgi:hypothetical protein
MKLYPYIIGIVSAFLFCSSAKYNEIKPSWILTHMYDSIKNIRTLQMNTEAIERIERKFFKATSQIKINIHPRKVYFHNPSKKLEILYDASGNHQRALVKPNVFPYLPLYLDPTGNIMRRNQHYTIHELGFEFIGKSIALTISKDKNGLANFRYVGKTKRNGYQCYMLEYENQAYHFTDYLVREKETASVIAYKLCVNDYLLRYKNDLLNDFGYLKRGSVLRVPTLYCKKAVLYIDENLFLPVSISLYDDIGLFESYDFTKVRKNVAFRSDEFSRDNEDYGF